MVEGVTKAGLLRVMSDAQPPDNPIVADGWAGIAFDRNRYEYFAPVDVWSIWLEVHSSRSPSSGQIGIASFEEIDSGRPGATLDPTLDSLHEYLTEDARFLVDHYVFSPANDWLVRLDQDVTIFTAELAFMSEVVRRLGGLAVVMDRMVDDFDPGQGDPVGLNRFLQEITRGLRS